jgi:2-keto-4-pentenoate hydratase/2-oxohepta-3-ene-1,7-dioic acid hydratase in catechol pathway
MKSGLSSVYTADIKQQRLGEIPVSRFANALACLVAAVAPFAVHAQTTPYKLGTFERQGRPFVGIVLREAVVIDLAAAHAAIQNPASTVAAPTDMKDLIARYEQGLSGRIQEIVRVAEAAGAARPAYVYDVGALKILPPIMYPMTMLNVAVNYREHDIEMARIRQGSPGQTAPTAGGALPNTTSAPGIWMRKEGDTRWNPFMFLKAPAAIVADGEPVRLPRERTRIEWECELGVVIGRPASYVPIERAMDHVFGYTLENDMSDRGGRGDTRYGSDWLVTKSHDTFAPMGPFITPKEFVREPGNLNIRFSLNGEVLQEGNTKQMIHTIDEQIAYASSLLTLRPGDVIATGTPPGAGSARTPPVLLKAGDRMVCTYDGIGTLSNPVVAPSTP